MSDLESESASDSGPESENDVRAPPPLAASVLLEKTSIVPPPPPPEKVSIRLVSIGSTPSVSPNVIRISGDRSMAAVGQFLRKRLRLKSVHLYIQNTFEPGPDELVQDLFNLFKTKNELIVSYCLQVAFG